MKDELELSIDNFCDLVEDIEKIMSSSTVQNIAPLQLSVFHYYIEEEMVKSLAPILEGKNITKAKWNVFKKLGFKAYREFSKAYKKVTNITISLAHKSNQLNKGYTIIPCRVVGNRKYGIDGYAVSLNHEDYFMVHTVSAGLMHVQTFNTEQQIAKLKKQWGEQVTKRALIYPSESDVTFDFQIIKFSAKEIRMTREIHRDIDNNKLYIREVKLEEEK